MRSFKHPLVWVICIALLSPLANVTAIAQGTEKIDSIVALVDDDVILRSELDIAIKGIVEKIRQQGGDLPPQSLLEKQVLERLIIRRLQLLRAFQTDTTRVCTLKLNNDHGTLRFPHLGVDYMIHHLLSHNDTDDWLKVNQFFLEQVEYLARRMDAVQEGDRTLLDNCMLMLCSSMLNGHHDANQLPVVMLGGGGGRIKGGQNLDYLEKPDRQMCRLYLSMMDKMGVNPETFGDATQPLDQV